VLEGNVFGTPKINVPVSKKLKEAGIPVVYADNHRYSFTHAKFWLIDDTYSISTGNWTVSFYTKNREYIYSGKDLVTRDFLAEIFTADMSHMSYKNTAQIPSHIVMSPLNARSQIESLITSTEHSIILYVQTLDDDHIISLIE
jgi:polyphosphate kinase